MTTFAVVFPLLVLANYQVSARESFHLMRTPIRRIPQTAKLGNPSIRQQTFDIGKYQKLENIYFYLEELENKFPKFVRVIDVGKTFEGRALKLVKIISGNGIPSKPAIWLDGGIHAREWISISTAIYVIHRLAHDRFVDASIANMLRWFDWYIMPVVNPDGYEYTWKTDRLWRKNRSPHFSKECPGVDLNRNFDVNFGAANNLLNPCDEKFPGGFPFSEPETFAIKNATENMIGDRLHAFISLHNFDQLWMFPDFKKSNKCLQDASKHMELTSVAAVAAIEKVSGAKYKHGSVQHFIGDVGGGSIDWVFHRLGVVHSFAVELPDRGKYGFNLPESHIIPTGKEILTALYAVTRRLITMGPNENIVNSCMFNVSSSAGLISVYHNVINEIRKYFSI